MILLAVNNNHLDGLGMKNSNSIGTSKFIEERNLEYIKDDVVNHPRWGYNPMIAICELSVLTDKSHMNSLQGITEEQDRISRDLDDLLRALDKTYVQLRELESETTINLEELLEGDLERAEAAVRNIQNKKKSIDSALEDHATQIDRLFENCSEEPSPFAGIDLRACNRRDIEQKILPALESAKRNGQNRIPNLMSDMQMAVQINATLNLMYQGMMDSEKNLRRHISQQMGRQ